MERTIGSGRVLVVEDEVALAESIAFSLEAEGLQVVCVNDGREAVDAVEADPPDLVLLDLMLPKLPGLDVLKAIRGEHVMPVIILTAKSSESDVVIGLELGADDYVTKPFSMRELVSRVRANLRRAHLEAPGGQTLVIEGGGVVLDADRHLVTVRGIPVALRPKEFDLLFALLARKDRLVTRDTLMSEVWGWDYVGDTKTLDVHVKRLRDKIEVNATDPQLIVTVRGLGYKFVGR